MPIYSSSSDSEDHHYRRPTPAASRRPHFGYGGGRPMHMHARLGGGYVADILLWRNKNLSAAILVGFTFIWFLFEVMEYTFVSLLCHISILAMALLFLWSTGAAFVDWNPPNYRAFTVPESTIRWLLGRLNYFLWKFCEISSGQNIRTFFLVITVLWILSVIGNYFSSLNLLYIGFVCLATLPAMYERYQNEVDYLASKGNQDMKKLYDRFDAQVLDKIPRKPAMKERRRF
nr:reticulon-like protein B9 [Ipomoea batatas]